MTMYLDHFGLREAPFRITPHTEFFFAGANRGATLEALLYAITAGEGMVKVTGEVGSGKTMLCRVLMERLPEEVETIYLAVPSLTRDEMLAAIAGDLGIEVAGASTTRLVRALQDRLIEIHSRGRRVVALIDEAHAMPLATLEEIRLLSNLETDKDKLLQIALFGQPELDAHLALPNMRQLKERITHSFALGPLPSREVGEYVNFRLRAAGYHGPELFGPDALRIITDASEGLTRRINIYADKTLLAAFAAGTHTITADHARAAVADTQIVFNRRGSPRKLAVATTLGIAAGVGIGFALAHLLSTPSSRPAAAAATPAVALREAPDTPADPAPRPMEPAAGTPEARAVQPPTQVVALPVAAKLTVPAPLVVPKPDARPADPIARRIAAGLELLGDTSRQGYAVQLMVTDARERRYIESYLAGAERSLPAERLFLARSGTPESPRLGVLFGPYVDQDAALAAVEALPGHLRQFRPYVRTFEALRDESRRAEGL